MTGKSVEKLGSKMAGNFVEVVAGLVSGSPAVGKVAGKASEAMLSSAPETIKAGSTTGAIVGRMIGIVGGPALVPLTAAFGAALGTYVGCLSEWFSFDYNNHNKSPDPNSYYNF